MSFATLGFLSSSMAARNSKSQQSSASSSSNGDEKQQQQQQQLQLKTRFFSEVDNRNGSVHCTLQLTHVHWMSVKHPDDIKVVAIGVSEIDVNVDQG